MRPTSDARITSMRQRLARAREQADAADYSGARLTLLSLRADCLATGTPSAHVSWCLASACDGLDAFAEALLHAREALERDPLSMPYLRTYERIVARIRDTLGDERRAVDDPATPSLYELLLLSGEGDARSHLAMARWHLHRGEWAPALRLIEAVVLLTPAHIEAWTLLARASRLAGQEHRALEAESEAAARQPLACLARA